MSPSMVDVRTPAAATRYTRDQGQIFTPFDQNPNPNPFKFMDQSNSFGKPSLSKPRFAKVRKNAAAHRRPASAAASTIQDPCSSGFNPFRSDKIEEKISKWDPFVSESGARVSESMNANGSAFGVRGTSFVLGSGDPKLSRNSSSRSMGSFDSLKSETFQFVSGSKPVEVGQGFVFGDGAKKSNDLSQGSSLGSDEGLVFSKPPEEEMRKLNLKNPGDGGDFEKKKQSENAFVFGAGSVKASMQKEKTEASTNFDAGGCVFGRGVTKSADMSRNSSFNSDEGLFSQLPEEMRNLRLKGSGNIDDFGKKKEAGNTFSFGDTQFSVSGSQPINVGMEKPTSHSFVFGSKGSGNCDAGTFAMGSDKDSFSELPNEMRKLNLKNKNMDDVKRNEQAENFVFHDNKTGQGLSSSSNLKGAEFAGSEPINIGLEKPTVGSVGFGSMGSGNPNECTFVFSSGVNKSVDSSQNSFFGSHLGLSELPEEMRKMNLNSGDGSLKTSKADKFFVFGSDKNSIGSFGSGFANKVPEETEQLNVGRGSAEQSMKNESAGPAAGAYVFGSTKEKNSGLSAEDPRKGKETAQKDETGDSNSFVFGTAKNAATSFGGSAVNTVHDNMEKMKIGTNAESLSGRIPFESNFQAAKDDHRWNMCSNPLFPAPGFQSPGPRFSFTGKPVGLETPNMEFKTPQPEDATRLTKETLFSGTVAFSAKKGDAKSTKSKKKKGKFPFSRRFSTQNVSERSGPNINPEDSTCDYSPMDYSPYREDGTADQYSRETSIASEDSSHIVSRGALSEQEEVLVSAAQRLNVNEVDLCQGEVGIDDSKDDVKKSSNAESSFVDEQTNKSVNKNNIFKLENMGLDNNSRTSPMQSDTDFFSSTGEGPANEVRNEFSFSSSLEDLGQSNFAFTASPRVDGPLSAAKHSYRRKHKLKPGQSARVPLASSLPDLMPHISISGLPVSGGQQNTSSIYKNDNESKTGKSKEEAREESTTSDVARAEVQEACEKWRFRGNQAYAKGLLGKAEDYYTCGINSVSLKEIPSSCIRPLTLCYSNRAATRMSLGKMREALRDCKMAVSIDPNFLKARVRVANCHLALGEIEDAMKHFKECLQAENISDDQKYLSEASDGLRKAQQVADLTGQSAELLLRRTSNNAAKALNVIAEALSLSPYSEHLLEMKAEALLMMRNYDEVIKLYGKTLDLVEQNSAVTEVASELKNADSSEFMNSPAILWRWHMIAKSYFYLGKLEEALELLQKREKLKSAIDKSSDPCTSFATTIQELLRLKVSLSEILDSKRRYNKAVEYYSSALACNAESRPFTAVCFCNRAAAYQALGQIADAIADCSLAIALDPSYPKAISRRATLHELIRDYGQAASDLNRLISLLQKQMEKKDNHSGGVGKSAADGTDLKRARARLVTVEEEARKGISLNMYMILGIESSSSAADIKKAYRKAALRHHPDKAGQSLVRNENVDDGLWREVAAEVHADADRLFKMIGEAYTVLSDPTKRLQYDDEEELRTCPTMSYSTRNTPKTSSDSYANHYERSYTRRQWRTQGSSYQRW
ncbi:uncharacterized protein LOC109850267 [Asparagus officinalis]|uniref:uncharacterized protein LOC109850267 n=1 Tax=Asparagus officinalis TaxID=4686 RepID=UPI00098DF256|nr:uncharacterized protein LOC109850267 [Asparagus officinalis]